MQRDAVVILASGIVLFLCALAHTPRVTCPRGWWAEGVRPDGETTCRRVAPHDCPSNKPCADGYVEATISARVYCLASERPTVLDDGRTVVCWRTR